MTLRGMLAAGMIAAAMTAGPRPAGAEAGHCAGGQAAPERLWTTAIGDAAWQAVILSHVVPMRGGGTMAFGIGQRVGESDYRVIAAVVPAAGSAAPVAPLDLSPQVGSESGVSRWIAGAVALPNGDVAAAIVLDGGTASRHRLLRFAPDGGVRVQRDTAAPEGPYERARMVMDGEDRVAILGSAGSPPTVTGAFESFDLSLQPVVRYFHAEANSAIFQFARTGTGTAARTYALIGDFPRRFNGEMPPNTGLFRVEASPRGDGRTARVIGPSIQDTYPNGLVFDRRAGTALFVLSEGGAGVVAWMDRKGAFIRRHPLPDLGEDFLPVPRLDAEGCALLFAKGKDRRVIRVDRAGTLSWRLGLRIAEGGELNDLAPLDGGGFVAVGEADKDAGGRIAGWVERYGRR